MKTRTICGFVSKPNNYPYPLPPTPLIDFVSSLPKNNRKGVAGAIDFQVIFD